jgi:hypothetical protein
VTLTPLSGCQRRRAGQYRRRRYCAPRGAGRGRFALDDRLEVAYRLLQTV